MSESPTPENTPEPTESSVSVDDVLIALQKSISRVSQRSASVKPGAARALMTGNVTFDLSIPVTFRGDSRLMVSPKSGQPLRLTGQIATDVRVESKPEPENAGGSAAAKAGLGDEEVVGATVAKVIEKLRMAKFGWRGAPGSGPVFPATKSMSLEDLVIEFPEGLDDPGLEGGGFGVNLPPKPKLPPSGMSGGVST